MHQFILLVSVMCMKLALAGEDGSMGRTDYPKETALLSDEECLVSSVSSGWTESQPETH